MMFAIKNYDNPLSVTYEDFEEDLKRFKYIKRLLRRYETQGDFKVHLILNHIIILYNAFGDAAGAFKELEVNGGTFITIGAL